MRNTWIIIFVYLFGLTLCIEHDFKGFDDTILFGINWPGFEENVDKLLESETTNKQPQKEVMKVTTSLKEKYECQIPEIQVKENISVDNYDGPSPIQLIKPLFSQKICSYRLESYWSYEVCHGRYIRQYHEEREGKQVKTQEYFLGHWSPEKQLKLETEVVSNQEKKLTPKTTKVEGSALPFVEMVMDDGTVCDLNGKPRSTSIKYVCYVHGKHEVYSFKEISTCAYEIIILSPLLCDHPLFKPKDVSENMIDCRPIGDSPKKPRSLLKMEVDSLRFNHQTIRLMNSEKDTKDVLAVLKVEKIEKDGETHLKLELHPLNEEEELIDNSGKVTPMIENKLPPVVDDSPVRAFLNGENCLNGGTGWWRYEFCYGKHVIQYHVDRSGERITLLLGKFEEGPHIEWIKENKAKAPKPIEQRTSISHFYSGGDICDKTGKPRQTEVKLKCLENSSSPAQVSLYLLEPKTCHYILGVESPLICEILPLADKHGLVQPIKPVMTKEDLVLDTENDDVDVFKNNLAEVLGND